MYLHTSTNGSRHHPSPEKKISLQTLIKVLENAENHAELHQALQQMLPGTAGLNEGREAHLLDVMKILNQVWNDMEVSTIACSWAKSAILNPSMEADIRAKHGSRTKCIISIETKDPLTALLLP